MGARVEARHVAVDVAGDDGIAADLDRAGIAWRHHDRGSLARVGLGQDDVEVAWHLVEPAGYANPLPAVIVMPPASSVTVLSGAGADEAPAAAPERIATLMRFLILV